jgi:DNA polymerase-3 subunit gamma/tau
MWQPVSVLNWDGNWPQLAASLPLRGVAQQLVLQAELIECKVNNDAQACFHLKVPLETLCSSVNIDKLIVALAGSIEFAFHFALLNAMIYLLTHNCPTQRTTCTLNSIVGKEGHQETVRDCVSFVAAVVG